MFSEAIDLGLLLLCSIEREISENGAQETSEWWCMGNKNFTGLYGVRRLLTLVAKDNVEPFCINN